LVESGGFLPDGLDEILIDQEDKLESGDFQNRVVVQTDSMTSTNLKIFDNRLSVIMSFEQLGFS
jgi:hypothetical protein